MSLADLNFDRGQDFAAGVWRKWGVTINYEEGKDMEEFILIAKFTRSRISLTEESVSTILLSCFGGRASLFRSLVFKIGHSNSLYQQKKLVSPLSKRVTFLSH